MDKCICNVELVTDDMEKALAKVHLDQSGFDSLKDELGPSRDTSLRRDVHLDKSYQDTLDNSDVNLDSKFGSAYLRTNYRVIYFHVNKLIPSIFQFFFQTVFPLKEHRKSLR